MKKSRLLISLFITTLLAACVHQKIHFGTIDHQWEITGEEYLDSTQFFTKDSLYFFDDPEHSHDHQHYPVTTLSFDKSEHTFSLKLRNSGMHGFYSIVRTKNQLILTDCESHSEDEKTWIRLKSDTFVIAKLNKQELVLTRK